MTRLVLAVAVLGLASTPADAATARFTIYRSPHTGLFHIEAWVSSGDNGGLASFGLAMTNISDLVLTTPEVALSEAHGMQPAGFNVFKQTFPSAFGASQDILKPANVQHYGVGQAAGVISGFPAAGIPDAPYDYPILLGTGKPVGSGPWDRQHPQNLPMFTNATANVYESVGSTKVIAAYLTAPVDEWPVLGDANGDEKVDFFDVGLLQQSFGKQSRASWADGDFDHDHDVDIFDAMLMQPYFGYGVASSPAAVPEPSTLALAAMGLAALAAYGFRRKRRF
ncbi:MAG: PEP-CTERM sorting domain-containing protein [Pirellulales bacterium]